MPQLNHVHLPDPGLVFSKFSELPTELRYMIWTMALPGPRVILLQHKQRKTPVNTCRITKLGFRSCTPRPNILLVCREAYSVASRYYKPAFVNYNNTSIPETYFDFGTDYLYLGPECLGPLYELSPHNFRSQIAYMIENELDTQDLSRVENLVIWCREDRHMRFDDFMLSIHARFDNVKNFTFVCQKFCEPLLLNGSLKLLGFSQTEIDENAMIKGRCLPPSNLWTKDIDSHVSAFTFHSQNYDSPKFSFAVISDPLTEQSLLKQTQDA